MTKARLPVASLRVIDTGWAWVVAAAACFCLFFTCGFAYSTGVYFVIFLETFGAGQAKTAWVSSLNFGVLCAVGPISSLIINNFSCRVSIFAGGILSTLGLAISAFVIDINALFITFGILTGTGYGLVFTPCVIVISEYFVKYRVIAMGLSISGTGLGTIVYPWLSRLLIGVYGWRGALLFSAGINLHVCVAGLLMRPNTVIPAASSKLRDKSASITVGANSLTKKQQRAQAKGTCAVASSKTKVPDILSDYEKQSQCVSLLQSDLQNNNKQLEAMNNQINNNTNTSTKGLFSKVNQLARDFDVDIFSKPTFIFIAINTFLFCFGMSVIYTHIGAYAASVGLTVSHRDSLISSIGFTNLIGRILLGIAAQFLPVGATRLFIVSYLLAGLGIACCAVFTSFPGLLFGVCMFGFFSAGFGPLLSEVTCLAVGVSKFSMAYGYLMLFMAAGTVIGAPVAGLLYDRTQFYQGSFYLGGACLILASCVMLLDLVPLGTKHVQDQEPDRICDHKKVHEHTEIYISSV